MGIHENFIGGGWTEASTAAPNVNPSNTRDIVGEYARGTRDDANRAIEMAKTAFPAWSRSSPQVRYEALKKVSDEILARKDELGRLLAREEGKILAEGIGEVVRAGQIFAFFAGEALRIAGEKLASVRPNIDVEITREPVGIVGLITPWNFPMAIPAWKIAPALAYGNSVVFKPADLVPGCAWALADILSRSGLPHGGNSQAGMVMVNLPTAGVDYHVPFGGSKGSSYGPREQGRYAVEFYTTVKTAYVYPGSP